MIRRLTGEGFWCVGVTELPSLIYAFNGIQKSVEILSWNKNTEKRFM